MSKDLVHLLGVQVEQLLIILIARLLIVLLLSRVRRLLLHFLLVEVGVVGELHRERGLASRPVFALLALLLVAASAFRVAASWARNIDGLGQGRAVEVKEAQPIVDKQIGRGPVAWKQALRNG